MGMQTATPDATTALAELLLLWLPPPLLPLLLP
jgi:hypothetical protein